MKTLVPCDSDVAVTFSRRKDTRPRRLKFTATKSMSAGGKTRTSGQGTAAAKDQDAVRLFRAFPPADSNPSERSTT